MLTKIRCLAIVAALAALTTGALADPVPPPLTLTGCLSVEDGCLNASGYWDNPCTSFCWTVSNECTMDPNIWRYEYTLTVPKCDIRKMYIEASSECDKEFTLDNLFDPTSCPEDWLDGTDVDWYSVKCTGIESPLYAIKFCGDGTTELTVKFDSDRGPRWGDFYAQDGVILGHSLADVCNAGFFTEDPIDAIVDNGTVCCHILVPDTGNLIPEPATLSLLVLGLGGYVARRRRK